MITRFYTLIGDNRSHNLPDMTSLAASRWLQNTIKCCANVRKMGPADRIGSNNSTNGWTRITTVYTDIHAGLTYSHIEYASPAISGRHLLKFDKSAKNAASDGFVSNFSGAAFCLAQPVGGFLVSDRPIKTRPRQPNGWDGFGKTKIVGLPAFCGDST